MHCLDSGPDQFRQVVRFYDTRSPQDLRRPTKDRHDRRAGARVRLESFLELHRRRFEIERWSTGETDRVVIGLSFANGAAPDDYRCTASTSVVLSVRPALLEPKKILLPIPIRW
jgi:hypothetical protein